LPPHKEDELAKETTSKSAGVDTSASEKQAVAESKEEHAHPSPTEPQNRELQSTAPTADEIRKSKLERTEAPQVDQDTSMKKQGEPSQFRGALDKLTKERDKVGKDGLPVMDDEERAAVNALEQANEQYELYLRRKKRREERQP
jgi:hypothetical protein